MTTIRPLDGETNSRLPQAASISPRASDPIAMANLTVKAVDQIGETAAAEIEAAAAAVEKSALELGDSLRALAFSVRENCKRAGEKVEEFCQQSTEVATTIRSLQRQLELKSETGE